MTIHYALLALFVTNLVTTITLLYSHGFLIQHTKGWSIAGMWLVGPEPGYKPVYLIEVIPQATGYR